MKLVWTSIRTEHSFYNVLKSGAEVRKKIKTFEMNHGK